jgi:hypothetical protein
VNRNERTPRTLADTVYFTGYPAATRLERGAGVVLAVVIGALLAIALVAWGAA